MPTVAAARARSRPANSKKRSAASPASPARTCWSVSTAATTRQPSWCADDLAVLSTADFFTPVVDDAFDWGRIAAANALSDIYAMGGRPIMAINLVGWPRGVLPLELMTEVLRGGLSVAAEAACPVIGGHSIDDPEPKYGMAVTGVAHPDRLLRNDAARPGLPLTLTKPIGVGLLNNRHKQTGEVFAEAVATMTQPQPRRRRRRGGGRRACGHGRDGLRPARTSVQDVPGLRSGRSDRPERGTARRRRPGGAARWLCLRRDAAQPRLGSAAPTGSAAGVTEDDLLLLADAQTSGGLLVVGELPGHPVIGHTVVGPGHRDPLNR